MVKGEHVTMENVVGAKVLIHLHRSAYDMLELQGVESERFVARVVGVDSFGMWVENPNYCVVPVYDDEGNYIPPEQRGEQRARESPRRRPRDAIGRAGDRRTPLSRRRRPDRSSCCPGRRRSRSASCSRQDS